MKRYREHVVVLFLAFVALTGVAAVAALPGHGRSQETVASKETPESPASPTAAPRERRAAPPEEMADKITPAYLAAAQQNLALKNGLRWAFGGKQQRGWYLYAPLVGRMLETEEDASSAGFASALARWQRGAGLAPTGVLDEGTLAQMVSAWQSARIKDRAYPSPDQLVTAPPTDFYDPSRPDELRQVEVRAYAAYKRMVAAAAADPAVGLATMPGGELAPNEKYLKIISSFRSREYQERLRQQSPHSGRAGLAVNSPHFTGRALDIYVGGEPVETKDANRAMQVQTRAYKWLVKNAHKFGFRPYYYEPWHWEYVSN